VRWCDDRYVLLVKDGLLTGRQMCIKSWGVVWDSQLLKEDVLVNSGCIEKILDDMSLLKLFDKIVLSFKSRQRRP